MPAKYSGDRLSPGKLPVDYGDDYRRMDYQLPSFDQPPALSKMPSEIAIPRVAPKPRSPSQIGGIFGSRNDDTTAHQKRIQQKEYAMQLLDQQDAKRLLSDSDSNKPSFQRGKQPAVSIDIVQDSGRYSDPSVAAKKDKQAAYARQLEDQISSKVNFQTGDSDYRRDRDRGSDYPSSNGVAQLSASSSKQSDIGSNALWGNSAAPSDVEMRRQNQRKYYDELTAAKQAPAIISERVPLKRQQSPRFTQIGQLDDPSDRISAQDSPFQVNKIAFNSLNCCFEFAVAVSLVSCYSSEDCALTTHSLDDECAPIVLLLL